MFGLNREQQAFWTLVALVQGVLFPETQGQVTLGSFVEHGVLERLVAKKLPHLSSHMPKVRFESIRPSLSCLPTVSYLADASGNSQPDPPVHLPSRGQKVSSITTSWFATAFTSALPPEACLRVWDCALCEGNKVMQRVALALIKRYETVISGR